MPILSIEKGLAQIHRQKTKDWLPRAAENGQGGVVFNGHRVWDDDKVLQTNSGDGGTIM